MRGISLGRNNYLFAGSDTGDDRAASLYTIIQTAALSGMNPEAYLRDTLGDTTLDRLLEPVVLDLADNRTKICVGVVCCADDERSPFRLC